MRHRCLADRLSFRDLAPCPLSILDSTLPPCEDVPFPFSCRCRITYITKPWERTTPFLLAVIHHEIYYNSFRSEAKSGIRPDLTGLGPAILSRLARTSSSQTYKYAHSVRSFRCRESSDLFTIFFPSTKKINLPRVFTPNRELQRARLLSQKIRCHHKPLQCSLNTLAMLWSIYTVRKVLMSTI